jgi:hypothetical protein
MSTSTGLDVKRAFVLGVGIGLLFTVAPSCSHPPPKQVCSSDNCTGCCDDTGSCANGDSSENCGSNGISCSQCTGAQACVVTDGGQGNQCLIGGSGGGSGGGSANGGGSAGGSAGGSGGGSGVCNAGTCDAGCCTQTGVCLKYAQQSYSQCGMAGATCAGCPVGKTCQMGACMASNCDACLDTAGNCRTDKNTLTDDHYCGRDGGICALCDTSNNQKCMDGHCVGMSSQCNTSNCDGCCSGSICIGLSDGGLSTAQCGVGAASCVTCTGGMCDTATGMCQGGAGGGGGGTLGLGGGTFGMGGGPACDVTTCDAGCCSFLYGCLQSGSDPSGTGIGVACLDPTLGAGSACKLCVFTMMCPMDVSSCM